ncbi:MAG: DMT family transporter, partial [Alphaproteobacteria bacterium]|nr:DMT family transporter [Alphaproteobacteria bacterium]
MNREALGGVAAGVGVLVLFAGFLVVSRFGATSTLTVWDMAALRFGVAGLCTIPVLFMVRWPRIAWWKALVLAITSGAPFTLFVFGGMSYAPVAHGGVVINGAMPVLAALLAWAVFGVRLGGWRIVGVALIVVGVAATGWDALSFGEPGQWRGHLLFLGAAACNATFLTSVRGWGLTALESLSVVNALNLAIYIPVWFLLLPSNLAATPLAEIALQAGYQGLVAAFIASILIAHAARTLGGMRQAAIMSGAP